MKLSEKITQAVLEGQVRDFADAYQGAMEEVAIWKKRALEAEDLNRKFVAEINGPTYMGEPAQPAPSVPEVTDAMIEVIESRAEQSYRRHHGSARGQQITPADALSWHIIHATREVLSAAPEVKP